MTVDIVLSDLRLVSPDLPPRELSPNARLNRFRQNRVKRRVQDDIIALMLEQGWPMRPMPQADIHVSFGLPDKRVRDMDNLISSCKAMLDALKTRVIEDDRLTQIDVHYSWFSSPRDPQTIIEVKERR